MQDYFKKLTKGTFTIFIFLGLSALIGYSLKLFFARTLTPGEIGLFYSTLSFILFFSFLRDLGITDSLVYFIPKYLTRKSKKEIKSIIVLSLKVQFFMSTLFIALIIIFSRILSEYYFHNSKATILLIFLSFYFLIDSVQEVLFRSFHGFQNMFLNQLIGFSFLAISTLGIVLVVFFDLGIIYLGLIYFLSALINSLIFTIIFFKKIFPDFFKYPIIKSRKFTKSIFKYSLPVMIANFSSQVFGNQTPILITYFLNLESVALYVYAYSLGKATIYFSKSINTVFAPMISEIWENKKKKKLKQILNEVVKYHFLINIPIAVTLFIFSSEVLELLFGSAFESASILLKILSIYFIIYNLIGTYSILFNNIGKPKISRNISFFLVVFNLIFNLILIPIIGLEGAVFSDLITMIITFVYVYIKGVKILKWIPPFKIIFLILIFSISFIFFPTLTKNFFQMHTIFKILISLVFSSTIYIILLFVSKTITINEIKFFFSLFKQQRLN